MGSEQIRKTAELPAEINFDSRHNANTEQITRMNRTGRTPNAGKDRVRLKNIIDYFYSGFFMPSL
jgi:hypothetical protein